MSDTYQPFFEHVKSGVARVRGGIVEYANSAACRLIHCETGIAFADPLLNQMISAAGQGLVSMPFRFNLCMAGAGGPRVHVLMFEAPLHESALMLVFDDSSMERQHQQLGSVVSGIGAELTNHVDRLIADLDLLMNGAGLPVSPPVNAVQALRDKLSKVQDVGSLLRYRFAGKHDRVMLNVVVRRSLDELASLALDRDIAFHTQGLDAESPPVYGSGKWLVRAVREYLEHALLSASPGDTVRLSLLATGARLLLSARSHEASPRGTAARTPTVPGIGSQQSSIGLVLSRCIVEQHGGSVHLENDFGIADLILELPAGGPASEDARMSVEQATRFAGATSDLLARSLARSRRPMAPSAAVPLPTVFATDFPTDMAGPQ